MVDYGEVVGDGFTVGLGILWAAVAANPWLTLLLVGIVVGSVWLQVTPSRRRRRRRR